MKVCNIKYNNLVVDNYFRLDSKFHIFHTENAWNIYGVDESKKIKIGEVLSEEYSIFEMEEGENYRAIPTGQKYINKYGLIENYDLVSTNDCPNRIKYKITEDNIIISSLRLAKAPATYFENCDLNEYIFSNAFYIFKVRNCWSKKYITKILQLKKIKSILDNNIYRGIGISSYKVDDLLKIEIRDVSINEQLEILEKISPLENKILNLISQKEDFQNIADTVFQEYFNYDYSKFEKLKKINIQNNVFDNFSNNTDLRFSSKFHREAGKFAYSELEKNSIKIKKVLESLSITGKGISPQDFEEETDCYYITMADISSWELDYENLKTVSKEYENNNSTKKPKGEKVSHSTKVKVGDILMMRSGEGGIGKVALVTEEINAIFSDFLILFRFDKSKYIPEFCYYYMRTKYFQYLVEINKKGLGNNTNIFPNNINEFPIPNISIDEQKIIVSEIEKKINEQKKIESEIDKLQEQISEIIETSIK